MLAAKLALVLSVGAGLSAAQAPLAPAAPLPSPTPGAPGSPDLQKCVAGILASDIYLAQCSQPILASTPITTQATADQAFAKIAQCACTTVLPMESDILNYYNDCPDPDTKLPHTAAEKVLVQGAFASCRAGDYPAAATGFSLYIDSDNTRWFPTYVLSTTPGGAASAAVPAASALPAAAPSSLPLSAAPVAAPSAPVMPSAAPTPRPTAPVAASVASAAVPVASAAPAAAGAAAAAVASKSAATAASLSAFSGAAAALAGLLATVF
ncbi:hypothetical protein HDU87_005571 [Geranomyces variabilis]|uniref:Uncharacterized protein n=1 Tax=Geranomyces variabilis TaxID=109894 RepID=A0AAD5THW6_9FUNG|nr:hypothetical protein HDU87_005571 [Geranomyces variabilis]